MSVGTGLATGLDVGGTKITGGVVTASGVIKDRLPTVPTPPADQHAIVRAVTEAAHALLSRHPDVDAITDTPNPASRHCLVANRSRSYACRAQLRWRGWRAEPS